MDNERKKQLREQYRRRPVVGGVYRIRNTQNGRLLLCWDEDLDGAENRHKFSVTTGTCIFHELAREWREFGPQSFVFERVEALEKPPEQERDAFHSDLRTLLELWLEKAEPALLYGGA